MHALPCRPTTPGSAGALIRAAPWNDDGRVDLFVTNVFDKRGELFRFNQCGSCSIVANYAVPTQPRTIALKLSQKF